MIKGNRAEWPVLRQLVDEAYTAGIRVHEVEKEAGIGEGVIKQWKAGKNGANLRSFIRVADVLNFEVVLKRREK